MAYDEDLANRIREMIWAEPGLTEKRMFGGLSFLINGHMSVSVSGSGGLLLHCEPDDHEALLEELHTDAFVMRGRTMPGWLRVSEEGCVEDSDLRRWVAIGVDFASSLDPK